MIKGLYRCFDHWHQNGAVWLMGDTHFGDEDLARYLRRPSDEEIVQKINCCVGKKDTFVLLGDVGDPYWVKEIRGYKILIKGNHDLGASVYEPYFDEVYAGPLTIGERLILSHEPVDVDWAANIHGHLHNCFSTGRPGQLNLCSDVVDYTPQNLNMIIKNGLLHDIPSIHRTTIDEATKRKQRKQVYDKLLRRE